MKLNTSKPIRFRNGPAIKKILSTNLGGERPIAVTFDSVCGEEVIVACMGDGRFSPYSKTNLDLINT